MPIPPTPLLLGNVVYSVNGAGLGRLKVENKFSMCLQPLC
jgi:hypothetical protein